MTTINTNVDDYTREELLDLVNLPDNTSDVKITETFNAITRNYISQDNNELAQFFHEAKEKLLQEDFTEENIDPEPIAQAEHWMQDQYRNQDNMVQNDKITQRHNKFDIFQAKRTTNPVMSRQTLGVNNTIPLKVAQDGLNPTLRQTITRLITIDSQYRPYDIPYTGNPNNHIARGSTNFTINLSEHLKNILSITIDSIYIPNTWYTFDPWYRNTCMWILTAKDEASFDIDPKTGSEIDLSSCSRICIFPGTYKTAADLVMEINQDISNCGNSEIGMGKWGLPSTTSETLGVQAQLQSGIITSPRIIFLNLTTYYVKLLFFRDGLNGQHILYPPGTSPLVDCSGCWDGLTDDCPQSMTYRQNLGYYLGFRITDSSKTTELSHIIPPICKQPLPPPPLPPYCAEGGPSDGVDMDALIQNISDANIALAGNGITHTMAQYTGQIKAIMRGLTPSLNPQHNSTVGWNGLVLAPAPINLQGSQYFYLALEDFNQNRASDGMIGIAPQDNTISKNNWPSYASKHSHVWPQPNTNMSISDLEAAILDLSAGIICDISSQNEFGSGNVTFVPTWPRTLTQNQLYSLNQIIANNKRTRTRWTSPDPYDVIAIITTTAGVNNAQALQDSNTQTKTRTYFGPITLERLQIRLYDDKGQLVNLNGHDWSFTIRAEQLYQY